MIRMQGLGGEGSGEVWRVWTVDMKEGGGGEEGGESGNREGETGRGQWGGATGRGMGGQ